MKTSLRWLALLAFGLALWSFAGTSFAQQKGVKVNNRLYKRVTNLDFGTESISGELDRPDGEYFDARRNAKYSKLLKLRENWKREILRSVSEL